MSVWDTPRYTAAMAGRLTGLRPERVRRWLQGYEYTYSVGTKREIRSGHKEPVVSRIKTNESRYASFYDLIDLLLVKEFLAKGLSLQRIRLALSEAEMLLGGRHFAHRDFFTDGNNIYLQIKDEKDKAEALMELLPGGQWVIAPIIKQFARQIDFHETTGFAEKWYPRGRTGLVVLDPKICFGAPTIKGRGVTTANVFDLFIAESKNLDSVCYWMSLRKSEAEAAVAFENKIAA